MLLTAGDMAMSEPDEASIRTNRLAEIWRGDLLNRRAEGELLAAYITSLPARPGPQRHSHAYTIAVDAGYGEGKTYFLTRLAEHLKIDHPVAFIDAWTDDLADQPLIALMATLKAALSPVIKHSEVQSGWSRLAEKGSKVAKIVALGAAKRALGVVISQAGADALSQVVSSANGDLSVELGSAVRETSTQLVDELTRGISISADMDRQIDEFDAAKRSIDEMKASLSAIVAGLSFTDLSPPIVIVIDELDRCRPSYAIKLLEEIKHLFDVPGLVFVFGLHGDQLAHSVRGAYGPTFDGFAYLKRFINRRYVLATPDLTDMASYLITKSGLEASDFLMPSSLKDGDVRRGNSLKAMIAAYAKAFYLSSRDVYHLVDILSTMSLVVRPNSIILPYMLPLAIAHITNIDIEHHQFLHNTDTLLSPGRGSDASMGTMFLTFKRLSTMTYAELVTAYRTSDNYPEAAMAEVTQQADGEGNLSLPRNYGRLISAVSKFESP